MLGYPVTAADGVEAVLRETGNPRTAQSQNVRPDFTAFISDGVVAYRQVRFTSVAVCYSRNEPTTYTLAMVAADTLRRVGTRLHAITASRKASPVPRVMVISNVGSFGGGGAVGFRDMVLAIREKRPDLDLVAVCPWKGSLAAECARRGIRTKIAWMPGWAFLERSRAPRIEALIGAIPRGALLLSGILPAVLLLIRLRPTMVLTNTMVIPSHAIAAKLLGIPHYWMVREFGRDDHRLQFLLGHHRTIRLIGQLSESVICNSQAV
ncbi:MAG: hypothetical protein ACLP0B_12155, partial [Steroidobacteraceae bacterium]